LLILGAPRAEISKTVIGATMNAKRALMRSLATVMLIAVAALLTIAWIVMLGWLLLELLSYGEGHYPVAILRPTRFP
jgi:hypothetical protein